MNRIVEVIEYNGTKVLFSDYSGLGGEEYAEVIREHYAQHRKMFDATDDTFLVLTDITDTFADRNVMKLLKETIKHNRPHIRKSAVIGVTGIQKVLLKSVNLFSAVETKVFETKDNALAWLTR